MVLISSNLIKESANLLYHQTVSKNFFAVYEKLFTLCRVDGNQIEMLLMKKVL